MDVSEQPPFDLYITEELTKRKTPLADFLREKQAIQELAARMVDQPQAVLPRFVELAMQMTGGVSAGLSLLESEPAPGVFRWRYLQGVLACFEDAKTPRNFSPCGTTLDRKGPVLALHPERFYSWISDANIVVPEVLLVPLYIGGKEPMGTLWIVSNDEGHFNGEHARIAMELASFVGIALKMLHTGQRLQAALEEQGTLAKEMEHRIKNLFAISVGIVALTAKTTETKEELAETLIGRFHALAAAHGLVRRSFGSENAPSKIFNLVELLRIIVKPHERNLADKNDRFSLAGPPLFCGERALSGIALVFHELVTNAVKYGALTTIAGRVDIEWAQQDGFVVFKWMELGGPAIKATPQTSGFGSKLLRDTMELQLQGKLQHIWSMDGLTVQISIPTENLAR